MVNFIDRNNNPIDWSKINITTFPVSEMASGIYGVDNIIDIMFLGFNGKCISVSPSKYKAKYGNYTNQIKDANWIPRYHESIYEPIGFRHLQRNDMNQVTPLATSHSIGAWHNKTGIGKFLSGYDFDLAKWIYSDITNNEYTEFFALYNKIMDLTNIMNCGYKLFRPDNFNHYQNWAGYSSSADDDYYNYMIVVYLTLPDLLQNLAFLRGPDISASLKSLARIENNAVTRLINDTCSSEFPSSSILTEGTYYTGTTIYSANSEYKFVVQADGNCVIYKYDGSVSWASDTAHPAYALPKIIIGNDGSMQVTGTRSRTSTSIIIPSISQSGFLHLDNGVLLMRSTMYNIIRWSSVNPSDKVTYDNANVIKSYHTFMPNVDYYAKDNVIKYSPNMNYYLKFTSDGVLELHRSASIAVSPPIKDTIIWDTSTKTKGHPNAILKINQFGTLQIADQTVTNGDTLLWFTPLSTPLKQKFLVADDNGYAALYNDNGYKGSYDAPVWTNVDGLYNPPEIKLIDASTLLSNMGMPFAALFAKSGVPTTKIYTQNHMFNKLAVGIQQNKIGTNSQSFSRACTNASYGQKLNQSEINFAQARYCANGLNLITDSQCNPYMSEENKNPDTEAAFQKYIIPKVNTICADGYNTRYSSDKDFQKRVNDFCSCKNPIDESRKIADQGLQPICYAQKCIESGYKSTNAINSRATCPKSICIQDINVANLQLVKGFNISCGSSADTTPTSTTTPNTPSPAASTGTPSPTIDVPASVFNDDNLFSNLYDYRGKDESYRVSPNGKYKLIFQSDGNLVLYTTDSQKKPVWASNTSINPSAILTFESNGNLQIYSDETKNKSLWSSKTGNDLGNPILVADDNGAVVIYQFTTDGWYATWSSIGLDKYNNINQSIAVTYTGQADNTSLSTETIILISVLALFVCLLVAGGVFLWYKKSNNIQMPIQQYSAPIQQYVAPIQQYVAPIQQYSTPTPQFGR